MAYDVNFSLLGPPVDVAGAVSAGYQHGRALRQQQQQDSAFAMLAKDPNSAEGRALLVASGHPDQARQFRQWGIEDRNEEFRRQALGLPPSALGGATAAPTASAFAPANAPPAPAGGPPASVPAASAVTQPAAPAPAASTAPRQPDPAIMQQWFATDPAGAREFITGWNSLNEAQREIASQRFTAAIPVLTQALSIPMDQRRAFIQAQAPDLIANGWSAEEIASFEPSDANVQLMIRRGLPITQQRDFFAPTEAGPGTVGRNRFSGDVMYANPTAPRTEVSYDANGNQLLATVPGTPAIGPGANLFGAGAQGGQATPRVMSDEEMRAAEHGGAAAPAGSSDLENWNRAGRAGPGGPRTFP